MRLPAFLLAIITGRLIRFGLLSLLTVIFGPQIVARTKALFSGHPGLGALVILGLIGLGYVIYRLLRKPAHEVAAEIRHQAESHK